jgi:hypothetical protein
MRFLRASGTAPHECLSPPPASMEAQLWGVSSIGTVMAHERHPIHISSYSVVSNQRRIHFLPSGHHENESFAATVTSGDFRLLGRADPGAGEGHIDRDRVESTLRAPECWRPRRNAVLAREIEVRSHPNGPRSEARPPTVRHTIGHPGFPFTIRSVPGSRYTITKPWLYWRIQLFDEVRF